MFLREFFYFDDNLENVEDPSYDNSYDQSVVDPSDTRVTRLCLKDINRARLASDFHNSEKQEELSRIRYMYKVPEQAYI